MTSDLEVGLELAGIADAITSARFRAGDLRVDTKSDGSPVTDADRRTEEALRGALHRLRPGEAVVGEEYGGDRGAEVCWLLDPIDGTRNYSRGMPVWATLIALMHGDAAVCGVVSAPALGRRWWASRGMGAHSDMGKRLQVSQVEALDAAHLSCTDVRDFARHGVDEGFQALLARVRTARAFGDFWSHMLVADGVIDIAIEPVVNPWDIAAAQVIVEESGGRFSDFAGRSRIDSGNVISSNGLVHDEVLRIMKTAAHE